MNSKNPNKSLDTVLLEVMYRMYFCRCYIQTLDNKPVQIPQPNTYENQEAQRIFELAVKQGVDQARQDRETMQQVMKK